MKEKILNQRFEYFKILPYKNYSSLDKGKLVNQFIHGTVDIIFPKMTGMQHFFLIQENNIKRKNTRFFYGDDGCKEIRLEPYLTNKPEFLTTKIRHLKKHFGNPFSSFNVNILERTVTFDENTLSIKFNDYSKNRQFNCRYFKKQSFSYGLKFDFKTGNIFTYGGGKKKRIRQNNFLHLNEIIYYLFPYKCGINSNGEIKKEFYENFNDDEFFKIILDVFKNKLPNEKDITFDGDNNKEILLKLIIHFFKVINEIKVPNDFLFLIRNLYPTKKFLKKNDNRLISAILDRLEIKSKSTIKLLHKYPKMKFSSLKVLKTYFGKEKLHKYIHNINPEYFVLSEKLNILQGYLIEDTFINNRFEFNIKDSERTCVLKIINHLTEDLIKLDENYQIIGNQLNNVIGQINDHLNMVTLIREFIPNVEMRAQTMVDFQTEHFEFSKLQRTLRKGHSVKYLFEKDLIEYIEEPIKVLRKDLNNKTFYPVLLKIDDDYTEEGNHMHHCVATYSNKKTSIIVSLREDNPKSNERVTCEFNVNNKSCLQEKYFCNASPPEKFEEALHILRNKIKNYKGSIESIGKIHVPLRINGLTIEKAPELDIWELPFN